MIEQDKKMTFNGVNVTMHTVGGPSEVDIIKFDGVEMLSLVQMLVDGNFVISGDFYGDDNKELVMRAFPNLELTELKKAGYGYPAKYRVRSGKNC